MKFYAASLCLLTLAFTTVLPAGEELFQQSIDLKSIAGGNGEGLLMRHGEIIKKVPQENLLAALKYELDHWEEE